jgi:hypothetical protein
MGSAARLILVGPDQAADDWAELLPAVDRAKREIEKKKSHRVGQRRSEVATRWRGWSVGGGTEPTMSKRHSTVLQQCSKQIGSLRDDVRDPGASRNGRRIAELLAKPRRGPSPGSKRPRAAPGKIQICILIAIRWRRALVYRVGQLPITRRTSLARL